MLASASNTATTDAFLVNTGVLFNSWRLTCCSSRLSAENAFVYPSRGTRRTREKHAEVGRIITVMIRGFLTSYTAVAPWGETCFFHYKLMIRDLKLALSPRFLIYQTDPVHQKGWFVIMNVLQWRQPAQNIHLTSLPRSLARSRSVLGLASSARSQARHCRDIVVWLFSREQKKKKKSVTEILVD